MSDQQRHQARQQRLKEKVDQRIAGAQTERGTLLVFTGNGKGKSTAAFGTLCRAVGHGLKGAAAQFIKGGWECGERDLLESQGVPFAVMATGFTWDTQDREADTQAARAVWQQARAFLADASLSLVVLDELTYMLSYGYLDLDEVLAAIKGRPAQMSVIVTGRGAHRRLLELADTVTEMKAVRHAFDAGIKARRGLDW
ncbi:cob(I)yrinic acid a,c-diamide adenosyltransferase [Gallaecimonas sp. GXIMD4217]|uniref:cob(I)yrinic acid a,c-diamide adenosyltransferase n=1 Tax=Gallaecimonas sp. GXIMD4217 TaxID=3131927 RepID=UPI00311AEA36